ncbi:hypothetical protein A6R68_01932 [Neotoma lepida]|uniref:BLOC-1-related complex subunit 7 n=1 Tax=Neotoma lepida TaxID=56216 RepID=A0A1A6GV36_NEOLE|nr:hypothetical protein A6R68_01932 [Neotoma lepida]
MATGTPDSQARFGQSVKGLLTEKVNTCGTDVIALTKQVLKGSRSSEVSGARTPGPALPAFAPGGAAHCILGVWALGPASVAFWVRFFSSGQEAIQKNVEQSPDLQDQLSHLLK